MFTMSIYHEILGMPFPVSVSSILDKYYLESNSVLVNHQEGTNGVDCWFEADNIIQHRCLSFEDFKLIKSL
jgi:hypothetical protein